MTKRTRSSTPAPKPHRAETPLGGARKARGQGGRKKPLDGAAEPPPPTAGQCEAWLAEVKGLHGKTNEAMLAVARWFEAKRDQIGRHFEPFIDGYIDKPTGLGWSRTQVYRMIAAVDTWDGSEHLDRFDRSALYSLSPRWPNRDQPTDQQKARAKKVQKAREACLIRAAEGEYISNKIALTALAKAGAVTGKATGRGTGTRKSLTVPKKEWNAKAENRGLDPEEVWAMLKELGITVEFSKSKKKAA